MAKAPVAGYAKTRLIPALGAAGAAALAARLLQRALQQAVAAGLGPVELCCAPDHRHPAFSAWAGALDGAQTGALSHGTPAVLLSDQGPGDLGARMQRAAQRALDAGYWPLLIGTDAPALDAAVLCRAAQALHGADAVLVPALDGGYALIGLRRAAPQLFSDMAWSTATVLADTRTRLAASGLRPIELDAIADIDEPEDLRHLPAGWMP